MKLTKKIGKTYVTLEDDEIDAYAIHNWAELKDCIIWSIGSLIVFGLLWALLDWCCVLINSTFFE